MPPPIDLERFAQIKATGHLPSPRGVALAVMRMAQDETISATSLAQVIKGDPAFVGRLIKAANGMLFRQRAIVSVREALMVVGLPAVRAMVLGFSLLSNYRKGNCHHFDYARFWSSSLIMAISMQIFANRTRLAAADELFSVGLLARVGELALATVYPIKYGRLLVGMAEQPGADLAELERRVLAMSHAELGTAMLMDWGIPSVFTAPVHCYEHPGEASFAADSREMTVMQCLILARNVAEICLGSPLEQQALMGRALKLAAHLGCVREVFVGDCNEIARQWREWSKLLQLGEAVAPPFDTLSGVDPGGEAAFGQESRQAAGNGEDKAAPPVSAAPGLRAMLVEKNATERARLTKALQEIDIRVSECVHLGAVMEQVLDVQPQILVLDGSDDPLRAGRLIKTLRASRIGRGMYILLLLPADDVTHMAVLEAGADDFFIKPAGSRMLLARLNAARRIVQLQQDLEHEREELRHFAAELAISNRCLQEAALTDALTGLPNLRYAHERMQQEWSAAQRNGRPLACMVVDIDNFKQINDIYGHDVGDMSLRQASDVLRMALRGKDVICRTGGDEFLVICPETSLEEAISCAERLRGEINQLKIDNESGVLCLTISVGVAVEDDAMTDVGDLVKKADRAVLLAKRKGRNRVAAGDEPGDDM
ncbi:MAG: diguanylate cyclase [Azoarcus sp.]|jgi:diguanylate cyclase (GGDEF)-like protein|nr:diguanylate cyclase [Azoarcus sp.]